MFSPKPHLRSLPTAVHGSVDHAEIAARGLTPADVLDFSANLNPYGPPPGVKRALRGIRISEYPDSAANDLRRALAAHLGTNPENVTPGAGATEVIRLAVQGFVGPGDRVLIPAPSYGEYATACRIAGAEIVTLPAREADGFRLELPVLLAELKREPPRAVFIGNPNNPTGEYLTEIAVDVIIRAAPDSLVVIDEAYAGLVDAAWNSTGLAARHNVIVVRSLTKDYALAGLRLGYALSHPQSAVLLERLRPPWNISAPAQAAGLAALGAKGFIAGCRPRLLRAKRYLMQGFERLGYPVIPGAANFFMVRVGDGAAFRDALLERNLLVRDAASFGLPEYIRVAPRRMPDCRALMRAVTDITER